MGVRLAWPVAAAACARVSRGEMPPQSGTAVTAPAPGRGLSPRLLPGPRGLAQMSLRSLTLRPPPPAARAASGQRGSAAQPFLRRGLPGFVESSSGSSYVAPPFPYLWNGESLGGFCDLCAQDSGRARLAGLGVESCCAAVIVYERCMHSLSSLVLRVVKAYDM